MHEFPQNKSRLASGSRIKAVGSGPIDQLDLKQGTVLTLYWDGSSICAQNPQNRGDTFTWSAHQIDREISETDWWEILPSTWYSRLVAKVRAYMAS